MKLETVDYKGVEILSEGGPYHGSGSPPEGDFFTADYLEEIAAGNAALAEVRAPVKIGHNAKQKLLKDSGLAADETPAAGWVENVRVETVDGVAKLLADLKAVPKKLGAIIEAGGYRTRSVEIGKVTAQSGEKKGEKLLAITGLALLGAKAPAVRTLDDIVALYADAEIDPADGETTLVVIETRDFAADVLWAPGEGYEALRADVQAALADKLGSGSTDMAEPSYWVRDVSPRAALVCRYENGQDRAWVVGYSRADDGSVTLADRSEWREAEQEWVEKAAEYAESTRHKEEDVKDPVTPADTPSMKLTDLSDEQVRALATTLGISEDVDGEALRDAVATSVKGLVPAEAPVDPEEKPEPGTVTLSAAEVAELKVNASLAASIAEERRVEKRDKLIDGAVEAGKIAPAAADEWRSHYDESPDVTSKAIESMPVNDDLLRAFGDEQTSGDRNAETEAEEAEYRMFAAAAGADVPGKEG